jgi:tetratricopeptide (TPR) repeat protein
MSVFTSIEEIFKKYSLSYVNQYKYLENDILNLYNNKLFDKNTTDSNMISMIGRYYYDVEKDYNLMKKYYLMAIELNNSNTMNKLALYYKKNEKDYDLMKKYYLMAIELNNSSAMYNLGNYYKKIEKDYDLMKKYFLMAIELNNSNSLFSLGLYYKNIKKDYDLMKKYYLMAIELNNSKAMNNLENCLNNPLQLYCELIKLNKNELIDKKIKELINNRQVNNYLNKCKHSEKYKIINDCFICLEENKLNIIISDCCHTVCKECYYKLKKCPLCK